LAPAITNLRGPPSPSTRTCFLVPGLPAPRPPAPGLAQHPPSCLPLPVHRPRSVASLDQHRPGCRVDTLR
jgi:hypothetical protein